MNPNSNASQGHERKDVDVASLFLIVLIVFVAGAVIFLTVTVTMHAFRVREPANINGEANVPIARSENFPQPRLEVKSGASLTELRAAEDVDLNSYGWIDRHSRVVRIPIDRAMQLLLERGLPDVGAGQTPLSLMQARPNETAPPPRQIQSP